MNNKRKMKKKIKIKQPVMDCRVEKSPQNSSALVQNQPL
jgi:hypothetical protein